MRLDKESETECYLVLCLPWRGVPLKSLEQRNEIIILQVRKIPLAAVWMRDWRNRRLG